MKGPPCPIAPEAGFGSPFRPLRGPARMVAAWHKVRAQPPDLRTGPFRQASRTSLTSSDICCLASPKNMSVRSM